MEEKIQRPAHVGLGMEWVGWNLGDVLYRCLCGDCKTVEAASLLVVEAPIWGHSLGQNQVQMYE